MDGRRFRFAPVALTIAVLVVAGMAGRRLRIDHDVERILPDSEPVLALGARALGGILERTIVDVGTDDGSVPVEALGRYADRGAERLLATGAVREVRTGIGADEALELVELIRARAPLLLTEVELREIEARLQHDAVLDTVARLERRIQEPDGDFLVARAAVDPLGFSDLALAPLAAMSAERSGARLVNGRIVSADGRHVLVVVEPAFPASDTERTGELLGTLESIVADLAMEPGFAGVRVRSVGAHRSTRENATQIRRDVQRSALIGIGAAVLLVLLCFGRIRLALLSLTPALVGTVCAFGIFSLFRDSIAAPVLGFGAVLVGLTVDFAVHVLARVSRGGGRVALPTRPLFLGAISTSLAFALLRGSALPGIRDIGTFGAIGILAAAVYARLVLPSFAPFVRRDRRPPVDLERLFQRARRPRRAVALALLVTPLIAVGAARLRFDGDVQNLSSLGPEAASDERELLATWGDGKSSWVAVEAPELDDVLELNDALAGWLEARHRAGELLHYSSIASLLPARSTQAARLERWRSFWDPERRAALAADLDAATARTRFRSEAFAPFVRSLDEDPAWITRDDVLRGSGAHLVRDRLLEVEDGWLALTPIRTAGWEQLAALDERLATEHPEAVIANREAIMRAVADVVSREMVALGALALLVVTLVVALWLGESIVTAVVIFPLVIALIWTLGLLGWLGQELNLINAIFVVFQFGIAVDYSIFIASSYLDRLRTGEDRTSETRAAALLCALTTCSGFGAMALAGHPVLSSIGVTALVGVGSAAFAAHLFVPVLCRSVLAARGPNGCPAPRNVLATCWMGLRGALHRSRALVGARTPEEAVQDLADDVRNRLPIGQRVYDGESRLRGACVLVANRESDFDALCVLALAPGALVNFPDGLRELPLVGALFPAAAHGAPSIAPARAALDQGRSVLVFPSARGAGVEPRPFEDEAFALARALAVPVQPVALVNTGDLRQPGGWVGDHDLRVSVLEALDPEDFVGDDGDARIARAAEDRIRARCAELRLEAVDGPQWQRVIAGMYRHHGPLVKNYAASKAKRDPLVRALARMCRGSGPILVVGCGLGVMTARLATAYPQREIVALDPDARKLDAARRALGEGARVRFVQRDVRELEPGTYEWILLADVLHYWDPPAQREILAHLRGFMDDGSRLLFRDGCREPGAKHWLVHGAEALATASGFTRAPGRFTFHPEGGWRELLAACGVRVETADPALGLFSNLVLTCSKAVPR